MLWTVKYLFLGALLVYALFLLGMPLFAGLNGDLYSGQRPLPDLLALLALVLLFAAMLYLCFCLAAAVSTRLGHIRLPMTAALLFCFVLAAGAAFLFLMAAAGRFGVSARCVRPALLHHAGALRGAAAAGGCRAVGPLLPAAWPPAGTCLRC